VDKIAGFTLDEIRFIHVELKVGKGASAFSTARLLWFNSQSRTQAASLWSFADLTQTHHTCDRTPLDE